MTQCACTPKGISPQACCLQSSPPSSQFTLHSTSDFLKSFVALKRKYTFYCLHFVTAPGLFAFLIGETRFKSVMPRRQRLPNNRPWAFERETQLHFDVFKNPE